MKQILVKSLISTLCTTMIITLYSCGNSSKSSTDGEIPQQEEEKWIECENCNGRGYFSHTCSSCNGSGRLELTNSETRTRTCSTCGGIGRVPCPTCNNNGYINCERCNYGLARCQNCDGAGVRLFYLGGEYIKSECGMCNGKGYDSCMSCGGKGRYNCNDCYGQGNRVCPSCHGNGGPTLSYSETNDAGPCRTCGGTGKTSTTCQECGGTGKIKVE